MGNQYFNKIKAEKRKKFYDEREWRYLPDSSSTEIFFGEKANRSKPVAKQNGHRMKLDLSQVEYIIIEKEADIEFMLGKLKELAKNNKIKYESLVSKLITSKQIEQDF